MLVNQSCFPNAAYWDRSETVVSQAPHAGQGLRQVKLYALTMVFWMSDLLLGRHAADKLCCCSRADWKAVRLSRAWQQSECSCCKAVKSPYLGFQLLNMLVDTIPHLGFGPFLWIVFLWRLQPLFAEGFDLHLLLADLQG